ncbi:MAG: GNAT family N-acetyltransferase [Methylococcaceae bacterium]
MKQKTKVQYEEVTLIPVKGTPGRGSGPGGEKWRIEVEKVQAGMVYINVIEDSVIGKHASIQIFLNLKSQGRGIGRIGYLKACELSQHATIYAHMRKSNIASRRAAEAAGFIDATPEGYRQLILVRHKSQKVPSHQSKWHTW